MFDKLKNKTKSSMESLFSGSDGSVIDVLKQVLLFIKESVAAINEAVKNRRYRKNAEKNGDV